MVDKSLAFPSFLLRTWRAVEVGHVFDATLVISRTECCINNKNIAISIVDIPNPPDARTSSDLASTPINCTMNPDSHHSHVT